MPGKVRDSVREINENSWLIGEALVLSRALSAAEFLWHDSASGYYYTLSEAPPGTAAKELPPDSHIRLVHLGAESSAVWYLGGAFLKVKLLQDRAQSTTEKTTLDWLSTKELSFNTPKALYYRKEPDRSYLICSRVPGVTLASAWQGMSEEDKQYYATRVATICKEMSRLTSHIISGIDGGHLPDGWLAYCTPSDYRPETLQENCERLSMDIMPEPAFEFFHNDLAPANILIDPGDRHNIGIIDWELAGYVPHEWIRTKFQVGWGMDCDINVDHPEDRRMRMAQRLRDIGFPEATKAWKTWFRQRHSDNS